MNAGGVVNTGGNLPNGSSNRRDDKGNKDGGARNSHKSASPAPDKLLRKEGKFVSIFLLKKKLSNDHLLEGPVISY